MPYLNTLAVRYTYDARTRFRRYSHIPTQTSQHGAIAPVGMERNLDCWGEKTSDARDADRRHKQKRSRQDEAETSSSSSSSSSCSDRKRKKERKKEHKQEKGKGKKEKKEKKEEKAKKAKKAKREKKEKKARKERKAHDRTDSDGRDNDTQLPPTVYAPPPPDVAEEVPPPPPASCSMPGAMRPEQAEAERVAGQLIVKVWDPSLGVERSVRANGEVVEQCVSAACLSRSPARARARPEPTHRNPCD